MNENLCNLLSAMTVPQIIDWALGASDQELEAARQCENLSADQKSVIEREILKRRIQNNPTPTPTPTKPE